MSPIRGMIGRAARRLLGHPATTSLPAPAPEPVVPILEDAVALFPDLYDRVIRLRLWPWRFGHVSNDQALAFLCLLAARGHAPIVEFGTFDGRTTYNLALNLTEGQVFTVDSGVASDDTNVERRTYGDYQVGECFQNADSVIRSRITQITGDSRSADLTSLFGRVRLVFIDGGHSEEACRHETDLAFALTRPGGVIVWDDYTPYWPGVAAVVNEVAAVHRLFHIPRLGLVVHVRE